MRIIGVMRINDAFAEYCHLTIALAARYCHSMCFLTNQVTRPEVWAAMSGCPNLIAMKESVSPWSHEESLQEAYDLGVSHGADWLILADHDEILPYDHLAKELFEAERIAKYVISFPYLNCWGSPSTIVDPILNATGAHGKVFRKGIVSFREDSFCVPAGYWNAIHSSEYPLRHCHMMTGLLRARRLKERGEIEPWAASEPPTYPFVPDWTIDAYHRLLRERQPNGKDDLRPRNLSFLQGMADHS